MATTADIPRLEMLQVADMVAREKGIEREEVLEAMEQAIQKAGRAKYGLEHDIRAEIDRKTGEIKLLRYMQVADPVENENVQVLACRGAAPQSRGPGRRLPDRRAAADRLRPRRRPDRQAGHHPAHARERAQAAVRGVQGSRRRDRVGRRQAGRLRQHHRRPAARRRRDPPRRDHPARSRCA